MDELTIYKIGSVFMVVLTLSGVTIIGYGLTKIDAIESMGRVAASIVKGALHLDENDEQ